MSNIPIVILTAMNVEFDAVRAQLSDIETRKHPAGTRYEVGRITSGRSEDGGCQIALGLTGVGNQTAAVLAERAIAEFAPVAILFTGVAGALQPHLDLGDVVVASHVYAYHGGTSEDDGLKARPRAWELSHRVRQLAEHLVRSGEWARRLPAGAKPRVRFGPIAAGEIVHYSAVSGERRWLHEHYNDAIAVEMEGAGTASAAHLNDALPAVLVRGISDYADSGKSTTDRAGWQSRAAINAAAFAIELASYLAAELGGADGNPGDRSGEDPGAGPFNVATGNAQVKVQAHTVYGGIRFGPDAGLGPAGSALSVRPGTGPGMLAIAARWVYTLISNATELTTKVTAALTAIRGLR
jgi:adenosylhomocysteine nucleosidase